MQILDGKKLAQTIKQEIAAKVREIKLDEGKIPHLAAVLVGNDGASETYVASKVKSCEEVGFKSTLIRLPSDVTEQALLAEIHMLNNDDDVDGFIVQLPLPKHINEQRIVQTINPDKDVDGFHPVNVGKMVQNLPCFLPATPYGILQLLERNKIDTAGKHCVVIGRSNIVGMPMSILMARKANPGNCTVTLCHSMTKNIKEEVLRADIIVAAIGIPEFVTGDMVKDGAVVIDVGITRVADASKAKGFALKGDVKFDEVAPKCSYITPVPGGVGPMTVVSLMLNTLQAADGKTLL
jgi:methylenetetrahydrofolate dehydrogenase (NADP+) / methenyltetrahydrofolate cyclohydrolase